MACARCRPAAPTVSPSSESCAQQLAHRFLPVTRVPCAGQRHLAARCRPTLCSLQLQPNLLYNTCNPVLMISQVIPYNSTHNVNIIV